MDEKEQIRQWVETWKRAGPELEAIRRRELQAMTDVQASAAAADVLMFPLPDEMPLREGSGLVEQQRRFAALRRT